MLKAGRIQRESASHLRTANRSKAEILPWRDCPNAQLRITYYQLPTANCPTANCPTANCPTVQLIFCPQAGRASLPQRD
jgi:hypothetical protein